MVQTRPADGNCGLIVTTRDKARELSTDKNVKFRSYPMVMLVLKRPHMAAAIVPALQMAIEIL
ncbi:hypothetical protein DESME_06965 [Desulfitobacterium metallireducens DSM 15288]|uniref:Uncharacterized protein n=1 Tax=Desulfitobacterium metallireducens DSM 15288 TaxID=871968 RepID=W0EG77_9FIRM|nr:hypothetical protein DESME_06965 [Desulfitobacterium metallireducens DSM 15288]